MVSQAKLRANRRNARKSTGPRTPEGKARSSRNAAVTNIFSRHVVLPGESHDYFHLLHDSLLESLQPQDMLQLSLAQSIINDQWRLMRLGESEARLYNYRSGDTFSFAEKLRIEEDPTCPEQLETFFRRVEGERDDDDKPTRDVYADPEYIAYTADLVAPATTMFTLLAQEDSSLERYEKHRERLVNRIRRTHRHLLYVQSEKNAPVLPPTPFLAANRRRQNIDEDHAVADLLNERRAAALREALKREPTVEEIEPIVLDAPADADDARELGDVPESSAVLHESAKMKNEPNAPSPAATPAPANACIEPSSDLQAHRREALLAAAVLDVIHGKRLDALADG